MVLQGKLAKKREEYYVNINKKKNCLTQNKNILNNNNFDIKKTVPIIEQEHGHVFC
jgi:hypothetical protein